jgi:hypothetical protein
MNIGYNKPPCLLPFDHRHAYLSGMFRFKPPPTLKVCAGILVDQGFGAAIPRDAVNNGVNTAMPTEKSESDEFEYGAGFARHIEMFNLAFAKVLMRYNPEGDLDLALPYAVAAITVELTPEQSEAGATA